MSQKVQIVFTDVMETSLPFHFEVFSTIDKYISKIYETQVRSTWKKVILIRFLQRDPESLYPIHLKEREFQWTPSRRISQIKCEYFNYFVFDDFIPSDDEANTALLNLSIKIVEHVVNLKRKKKFTFSIDSDTEILDQLRAFSYPALSENIVYARRLPGE